MKVSSPQCWWRFVLVIFTLLADIIEVNVWIVVLPHSKRLDQHGPYRFAGDPFVWFPVIALLRKYRKNVVAKADSFKKLCTSRQDPRNRHAENSTENSETIRMYVCEGELNLRV